MNRSQKRTSRAGVRKRRRLKDQRQRERDQKRNQYIPGRFTLRRFFRQHNVELALVAIMAVGIVGVISLGPDKKAANEVSKALSSGISEQAQQWKDAYPYGYKILALSEKDIIRTSYDTLPKDLKINWDKLSVARIQSSEFGSLSEKIKLVISGIYYIPGGVSDLTVSASFIRKKGAVVHLTNLGQLRFFVEVIEDRDDRLFCLFGLRD